ncbi:MAG: hypothetical protein J6X70_11360 [Muribaculaceae bacterium]|nr:hypothetical protein [Muribaculaceae bacterium]
MKLFFVTIGLIAFATALLGIKVFFTKNGRFPNTHIHGNPEMKKRGITCARDKDFNK